MLPKENEPRSVQSIITARSQSGRLFSGVLEDDIRRLPGRLSTFVEALFRQLYRSDIEYRITASSTTRNGRQSNVVCMM